MKMSNDIITILVSSHLDRITNQLDRLDRDDRKTAYLYLYKLAEAEYLGRYDPETKELARRTNAFSVK